MASSQAPMIFPISSDKAARKLMTLAAEGFCGKQLESEARLLATRVDEQAMIPQIASKLIRDAQVHALRGYHSDPALNQIIERLNDAWSSLVNLAPVAPQVFDEAMAPEKVLFIKSTEPDTFAQTMRSVWRFTEPQDDDLDGRLVASVNTMVLES